MPTLARIVWLAVLALLVLGGCRRRETGTSAAQPRRARLERAAANLARSFATLSARPGQDPAAILSASLERAGGAAKLDAVRMVQAELVVERATGEERMLASWWLPDRLRLDTLRGEVVEQSLMLAKGQAFLLARGTAPTRKLTQAESRDLALLLEVDLLRLLPAASRPEARERAAGVVPGRSVDAVEVDLPGRGRVTAFVDGRTRDLVATRHSSSRGRVLVERSDQREVSGLRLAHRLQIVVGSDPLVEVKVIRLTVNPPMPDKDKETYFDPTYHPFYR